MLRISAHTDLLSGFTIPRDINLTLNFLNIYQFAVWFSLEHFNASVLPESC